MEKIIVFGNGDVAKVLSHYLAQQFEIVAYTVDDEFALSERFNEKPLVPLSQLTTLYPPASFKMLTAVGFTQLNKVRESTYNKAKELGYEFVNYIDTNAKVLGLSKLGENNIILDNVSVQPDVSIGCGNILWSNSTLAHGSSINNFNWVTSGTTIAGDVSIGNRNFFGINSSVAHTKTIESDCLIAANTLVNTSLTNGQVVLSEPGEIIKLDSHRFIKFSGM